MVGLHVRNCEPNARRPSSRDAVAEPSNPDNSPAGRWRSGFSRFNDHLAGICTMCSSGRGQTTQPNRPAASPSPVSSDRRLPDWPTLSNPPTRSPIRPSASSTRPCPSPQRGSQSTTGCPRDRPPARCSRNRTGRRSPSPRSCPSSPPRRRRRRRPRRRDEFASCWQESRAGRCRPP